ncbi:lysozyme [Gemmata sp. G18]|uniref:Lysozyme n=1 Tax=Gemmata palustris TaxID=2822762 RepID=A0ABS5BNR7_9BACT|nr:lysozyme [Gemmata palustris]MBP3955379.1 lysozyme [Gemmata palustris]
MILASLLLMLADNPTCRPCKVSPAGIGLIQHFEGYSPFVYEDVAGKKTIGFGHLILPGERFREPMLPDEATKLLEKDAARTVSGVNRMVRVPLRQGQADSLHSFAFNLGTGALQSSTLLKRVNSGRHADVPGEFLLWNKARVGGVLRVFPGLTRRREAESEFYQLD